MKVLARKHLLKYKLATIIFIIVVNLFYADFVLARLLNQEEQSFALEYKELRILLQKVNNQQTAIKYRPAIEQQILHLQQNQLAGEGTFESLSESQQRLFVNKFQNNHLHCGEVTQVMAERRRILLHPELAKILRELLDQIP